MSFISLMPSSLNLFVSSAIFECRFDKLSSILHSMEFSLSQNIFGKVEEMALRSLSILSLLCLFLFGDGFELEPKLEDHSNHFDVRISSNWSDASKETSFSVFRNQ